MAYVKIKVIRSEGHLKRATNYAMTDEKTVDSSDIDNLLEYVADERKVWHDKYVSGINCNPKTAAEKMAATKKLAGKEDGRLGYHIIQSFLPGEVTPELAHKISLEYTKRWLSDFEAVIGTHLDREHIHSHIVVNSVSCITGNKFHMTDDEFYKYIFEINNEICKKYGLSVIDYVPGSRMPYAEYLKRHRSGRRSFKQMIVNDIETCIAKSESLGEFYIQLENMGYEVDTFGKYPKIKPPEGLRFFRIREKTLGYSPDIIEQKIHGLEPGSRYRKPQKLYCKRRFQRRKLTRYEALYLYYMYKLGKIRQSKKRSQLPMSEFRKFYSYKRQLHFVTNNHITKKSELLSMKQDAEDKLKKLTEEKYRLKGARRKYKALFEAHVTVERYKDIMDKLDQERREEIGLAMDVIKKKGFSDNYEEIAELRMRLEDAKAQNKTEYLATKNRLKQIDEVLRDSDVMIHHIETERWQQPERDDEDNQKER
ncbi:relaxase/mobilization nuclease domain-containing protein [Christensenellaceae bacterium OttesenSCG-928-K19]|nr:relaxase/mobilization nuclease domain-containing protein [Christensenellaceae bacterium OttesenSCG-928-K19]